MPQINLLPWREELRKRRNKDFGVIAVVAGVVMAGVWFAVHLDFQQRIDFQNQRNQFLQEETVKLDKKIKQIQDLDKEKERLLARMQIIQQLQSSRPEIVHLFDAFVKTLPDGVFYTRIEQKGHAFTLTGIAQSNARVSSLMRALENSPWFQNPSLVEIKAETKKVGQQQLRLSSFTLKVQQEIKKKKNAEGKS